MRKFLAIIIVLFAVTAACAYPPQNTPHNRWQNQPHNRWQNTPHNHHPRPYYHPPYSMSPPYQRPFHGYGYGDFNYRGRGYGYGFYFQW